MPSRPKKGDKRAERLYGGERGGKKPTERKTLIIKRLEKSGITKGRRRKGAKKKESSYSFGNERGKRGKKSGEGKGAFQSVPLSPKGGK